MGGLNVEVALTNTVPASDVTDPEPFCFSIKDVKS
jgi:hypothetical protein